MKLEHRNKELNLGQNILFALVTQQHNKTRLTSATPIKISYSVFVPENILHRALLWRRTEQTSSSQLGRRCWLAARSSAMEPLFPLLSLAPYPTSRASTTTIRVWAGGGRSNRGPNTALRACKKETDTRKRLHLRCKKCRIRGQMRKLKANNRVSNSFYTDCSVITSQINTAGQTLLHINH